MKRFIAIVAVAGLASACATAPGAYDVRNTRTYPQGKDAVWERVVETFASENLSIKTIEKDSGIIAADRMFGSPIGGGGTILNWADCGKGGLAIALSQAADLNVFVRPVAGGTSVTVNTRFQETRKLMDTVATVQCVSTGNLEERLLTAFGTSSPLQSTAPPGRPEPAITRPATSVGSPPPPTASAPAAAPTAARPQARCGMIKQRDGTMKMVPC
jgi:hypothetical protein